MIDVLFDKKVKARKSHKCDLCRLEIKKGETYRYSKLADCGELWTWKEHLECSKCAHETLEQCEYEEVGMWAGNCWIEHMNEWKDEKNKSVKICSTPTQ